MAGVVDEVPVGTGKKPVDVVAGKTPATVIVGKKPMVVVTGRVPATVEYEFFTVEEDYESHKHISFEDHSAFENFLVDKEFGSVVSL